MGVVVWNYRPIGHKRSQRHTTEKVTKELSVYAA